MRVRTPASTGSSLTALPTYVYLHVRRSQSGVSCAFGVPAELRADSVRSKAGVSCASRLWSSPAIRWPGATTGVAAAAHTARSPTARTTAGEGGEVGEGSGDGLVRSMPAADHADSEMALWRPWRGVLQESSAPGWCKSSWELEMRNANLLQHSQSAQSGCVRR